MQSLGDPESINRRRGPDTSKTPSSGAYLLKVMVSSLFKAWYFHESHILDPSYFLEAGAYIHQFRV